LIPELDCGPQDLKARTGVHHRKAGGSVDHPVALCKSMIANLKTPANTCLPSVADDPRWRRVLARDKTADGQFWYSVATTGVYCRPSCPSRTANPENVQLHGTLQSAKATGFRP